MKFAFCLFKYFPFGGLQRDFLRIAEECLLRGHTVDVYTMVWQGNVLPGLTVHLVPVKALTNHQRCWRFSEKLNELLANNDYDAIVGFNKIKGLDIYYAADPCYAAKIKRQKPYWYQFLPRYKHYAALEHAVFATQAATDILLIAEREQHLFQAFYATQDARFYLLPPGIARDRRASDNRFKIRAELRRELNIPLSAHLILFIGSGFKTKGLDRAIAALAALPSAIRNKTYLCVIGQDNPRIFARQAKKSAVEHRVKFLGGREDVPRFLSAADILLHPAYAENTGTVLLEALVAGLPVLTTDVCGYGAHIERAEAGIVLPSPFAQAELNQALSAMLTDAEQMAIWRKNACNYAEKTDLYSLPQQAADYLEQFVLRKKSAHEAQVVTAESEVIAEKKLIKPAIVESAEDLTVQVTLATSSLAVATRRKKSAVGMLPKIRTDELPAAERIDKKITINRGLTRNAHLPWYKPCLELNEELKNVWPVENSFTDIFQQDGQIYRQQKNRRTLLFHTADNSYFLKLHQGIGWREIIKNSLQLRWPVLGAHQEWRALVRLNELGINTAKLAGFGSRGRNPAKVQSFVVMEELHNTISLEDFCQRWLKQPPLPRLKWTLIKEVARIARVLHGNQICHRDFYLCHFLLDITNGIEHLNPNFIRLYLIDLHRVKQARFYLLKRWIIKDLAGLYFSSLETGLTRRDLLRFIKHYTQKSLAAVLNKRGEKFWRKVVWRAYKLYGKEKLSALNKDKLALPFNLVLSDGSLLMAEQLLRVIPQKRWVLLAQWPQHQVVAKVFRNWRDAKRELLGYETLINANIKTPKLLYHGWMAGEKLYALLFEYIYPAQNYANLMAAPADHFSQHLEALIAATARLHAAGLRQTDLHFKNFLLSGTTTYVLDPAGIKSTYDKKPLREGARLKNLALLLAQLPAQHDGVIEQSYIAYTKTSDTAFTSTRLAALKKWIINWRCYRLRRYQRKVLRSTTWLICRKNWWNFSVCDRVYDSRAMQVLLRNPDAVLNSAFTKFLKKGNTCTVGLISVEGRLLVVKRYNIKNVWHGLKRAFTASRAAKSWRNAQLLQLLEIPTPKPVAMMERRCGPLRHTAYFISEYAQGIKLSDFFNAKFDKAEARLIAANIKNLLDELALVCISHGDLKATNIILVDGQPVFIDLDAMRLHRFKWLACRAWRRDWLRFLRNWEGRPKIFELFQ